MRAPVIVSAALTLALAAGARAESAFQRPACPEYPDAFKTETRCVRDLRKQWQEANFARLQKTGLMFAYMARPDIETSPAAKAAIEGKVEGSFALRFSVATDGTVYNVKTESVTEGIEPLAKLWADTIAEWTFAKVEQAVADVEYRRIYLYSREDDAGKPQEPVTAQ